MLRSFILALAMAAPSLAQPPAAPEPARQEPKVSPPGSDKQPVEPTATDTSSVEPTIDIWTEARIVLEKELETVQALNSLKGSNLTIWQNDVDGRQPIRIEYPLEYAVEKPNKLFLESKDLRVFADGTTLTVYSKSLKQYVQRPMPDIWMLRATIEKISDGQIRGTPGEPILRHGMRLEQTLRNVKSVERVRNGDLDGRRGAWVSGTAIDDRQPGSIPYTFERWYSDEDHLVHRIEQDWTAMYQDIANRSAAEQSEGEAAPKKADRYLKVGMTTTFKRELNPKLPASTFVFTPAPDDKPVEVFVWPRPSLQEQVAMIGRPAPAVVGKDFGRETDGKVSAPNDVDIAAHRGKVVVLDFWALWCPHCLEALPSMQAIKNKYGDRLMLIGVNNDNQASDENRIRKFLATHAIDIQQLNDIPRTVANTFHVQSWPCVVVIDQQGVVADIDVGYLPGKEKDLQAKIETLLSGKPLRTPEELVRLRQQVGLPTN